MYKVINSDNKLIHKLISISVIFTLFISLFTGCGSENTEAVTKTGFYFDTVISITLYGNDKEEYIDHCFSMASKFENEFSNTITDSTISKINAAAGTGEYIKADQDTLTLIKYGLDYSKSSQGKFDITVGALSNLWNFTNNDGTVPTDDQIQNALKTVNYEYVSVKDDSISILKKDTVLDLGGIAKGYIADQMKAYLNDEGITSGIINLGGNVLTIGPKEASDTSYTIGIQKPFSDTGEAIASISITDESVVTSGTYQRYFEKGGKIYHHILDLSNGYPVDNGLDSVTIISKSSVEGDALSTTVFCMGYEDGLDFIESNDDLEAIFIFTDGSVKYSSGVKSKYNFKLL